MSYNKKYAQAKNLMKKKCEIAQSTKEWKAYERSRRRVDKLFSECPHEELEALSSYYNGSYYDKAYTRYWNECKLCGKTFNEQIEQHSWYG